MKHLHRVRPGFYTQRETPTRVLHVFKVGRKWYYARVPYTFISSQAEKLLASCPAGHPGYPTYAMALSAAQGNRAS